jgi:outer membrane protein assembly factor BamB
VSSIVRRLNAMAGPALFAAALAAVAACSGSTTATATAGSPAAGVQASPTALAPTPVPTATPVPTDAPPAATISAASSDARVLWSFATGGAIYNNATIAGGAIYVGSDDGYLYSIDTTSHALRWKFKTGGLVRSVPAIDGALVYVASDDGDVYAVKTADGSQAWKADIGNAANPRVLPDPGSITWDFHQSSPVVSGGVVYVGSADKNVYALDAATGATKWTFKAAGIVRDTPAVSGGVVYVGSWMDGMPYYSTLYALDAKTGTRKWAFMGAGDHPTPVVVDGTIYIGGRQAFLYAIDAQAGISKWMQTFKMSWVESTCAYDAGSLYVGSSALGLVQKFDAASGNILWQFAPRGEYPWSSPAVAGGTVFVGSASGGGTSKDTGLWAIDAGTGRGLWWVAIGASSIDTSAARVTGIAAGPIVADGVVYVGSLDGKLYAVKGN